MMRRYNVPNRLDDRVNTGVLFVVKASRKLRPIELVRIYAVWRRSNPKVKNKTVFIFWGGQ